MTSRLKERGGAGSKVMVVNPHMAAADKPLRRAALSSGKENLRSISTGRSSVTRHRPSDPIEKPTAGLRRSTSSIPRASTVPIAPRASLDLRSSTTGAPNKVLERRQLSAGAKDPSFSSRCGIRDGAEKVSVRVDDRSKQGGAFNGVVRRDAEKRSVSVGRGTRMTGRSVGNSASLRASSGNLKGDLAVVDMMDRKQVPLSVGNSACVSSGNLKGDLVVVNMKDRKEVPFRDVTIVDDIEKPKCGVILGENVVGKNQNGIGEVENAGEVMKGEKKDERVSSKYPSKLHERLALLEGKVQRIATDIRKTKEMLDLNSVDASKTMLSDIRKKIMGIEKVVGDVKLGLDGSIKGSNTKLVESHNVDGDRANIGVAKNLGKTSNEKEMEAHVFPHQKLLKSDKEAGNQREQDGLPEPSVKEYNYDVVNEDVMVNIDENPIALEFLESLKDKQPVISTMNEHVRSAKVMEMGSDNAESLGGCHVDKSFVSGNHNGDVGLMADERLEEFDGQENKPVMMLNEEYDDSFTDRLFEIGHKPSTGGWFVSDGEAVLLTHSDGSCTYFDVANNEEKSRYEAPTGLSHNLWGDCWLIRAPGVDGCSGKYVVAASAGNTLESGFCSWDFYKKDIQAFKLEPATSNSFSSLSSSTSRTVLGPLSNMEMHRRAATCLPPLENQQWWYRPCGYLILSTSSRQNVVSAYDVRDGTLSMTWAAQNPIASMEYSCPLQWRSRGRVILAGTETISLWDVNTLNPKPLQNVPCDGKKILALHVNNTDAELGGGVRQRVSSSEAEGNDGVFCTADSINILDHRQPNGIGLKIPTSGPTPHSVFTRADSILLGCMDSRSALKPSSCIQSFSLRKAKLIETHPIPGTTGSHPHHSSLTQLWGNSNMVMGISGMGLSIFGATGDDGMMRQCLGDVVGGLSEMVGPDDLYRPSFDYIGGRVLIISRDRPAMWKYLL